MASDATRYEELVAQHGLSGTHRQTLAWVPEGARVLELGCSSGFIGSILIKRKGCHVTGVEVDPAAAEQARQRGLTVHEGSLESAAFRDSITGRFDVVIAADVLEHLSDPAPCLAHCKRWLEPNGRAVVAVPNVATWSMRAQLFFRGDFDYQDTGLLDRTHLRFFTWHSFHRFVQQQGWHIEDVMVDSWELPLGQTLLFDWPQQLRRTLAPEPGTKPSWRAAISRQAYYGAGSLIGWHQSVAARIGKRFPNLCATHIAFLLRPDFATDSRPR